MAPQLPENPLPRNPKLRAFLKVYTETANVTLAAKAAGITRGAHYQRLKRDPAYRAACEEAEKAAGDRALKEAYRIVYEGIDEPVFQGKELVGFVNKRSETLLVKLLEAFHPKFSRSKLELTGKDGSAIKQALTITVKRMDKPNA